MSAQVESIARMVSRLAKLPGIGQKSAQRLAYHIIAMPEEQVKDLADAIYQGKVQTKMCPICGDYTDVIPCPICADERRHNGKICVVRDARDVAAIERMHEYRGLYHVLGGTISPMNGVGPDDIRVRELLQRLSDTEINEVILATNPDVEGEATASYLARIIKPLGITVSRIAHGLPVGSELEYTDEVTLLKAIEDRRQL